MAWDIYGNRLTSGYCEVHPWVPEEYPCYQCIRRQEEENERRRQDDLIQEHYWAQIKEHEEEQELEVLIGINQMVNKIVNHTT